MVSHPSSTATTESLYVSYSRRVPCHRRTATAVLATRRIRGFSTMRIRTLAGSNGKRCLQLKPYMNTA
jgi:hypothetical protein